MQGLDMYDMEILNKYVSEYKRYGMRVKVLGWRRFGIGNKIAIEYLNHNDKTVVSLISQRHLEAGLEDVHIDAQPIDIC